MKRLTGTLIAVAAVALIAAPVLAHEHDGEEHGQMMSPEEQAMMDAFMAAATPGHEQEMLAESVGDYDMVVKTWMGGEATEDKATAKRHMMLGGRVLVEEVSGTMMDMPFEGYGMTGYDNVTGKYWSTWNDNMSTGVMVASGTCNDSGDECTFTGTSSDPMTKKQATSRMVLKRTSPTTELFTMYGAGPDGNEMKMMEITYTKK